MEKANDNARLTAGTVAVEEIPDNALRLLGAAVDLFAQKGYAATSVREIVQRAEVTNPMLYYYFDSKEGLFLFLTQFMHAEFRRSINEALQSEAPFERRLVSIVDVHFAGLRDAPEALRFVYSILFAPKGSTPHHRLHESHEVILESVEELLREATERGEFSPNPDVDVRWSAGLLLGLANSHVMRVVKELEHIDESDHAAWIAVQASTKNAEKLVRFFLHGAGDIAK